MDDNMIIVNNLFGHWLTDIDMRRYPDNMMILPTNNSVSIANYSNAQIFACEISAKTYENYVIL